MLLLDWTLPLPITENLPEGMPVSALLPISVTMLCNLKANLNLVFPATTNSSCLQSRLLTLTNLITCFVPGQCLILPSLWAHFKAQITCSTEYQKQELDQLTSRTQTWKFSSEAFSKNEPHASIPLCVLSRESPFLMTAVIKPTDLWGGIVQMAGPPDTWEVQTRAGPRLLLAPRSRG